MTTIRELSETLGVSKTTILKYVKAEMQLQTTARTTLQLSANQCAVIANHFSAHEQAKQKQSANTTENQLQTCVQLRADEFADLRSENAALKAENDGLRQQIKLLHERLDAADAALEREQMQARGFWSKLGQKLLREGRD